MSRSTIPAALRALLAADRSAGARALRLLGAEDHPARVTCPADASAVVRPYLAGREEEALVCAALDRRRGVVDVGVLTVGSDAFTIVDARQVYRWALTRKRPCAAIILAHNHPSGDPTPSTQDIDVTERAHRAGRVLGIPLLDHVIVVDSGAFASLAELGHLPPYVEPAVSWTGGR